MIFSWTLFEPICAGISVSLINKYIINNKTLFTCCHEECCTEAEDIDARHNAENGLNTTTTIDSSDTSHSFGFNEIHISHV